MSDIELVIKIPKKLACEGFERPFTEEEKNILIKAIGNGTPLPEGHGRLIDANYLKDVILLHNFHGNNKNIVPYKGYRLRQREVEESIINVPTIIESDATESEE